MLVVKFKVLLTTMILLQPIDLCFLESANTTLFVTISLCETLDRSLKGNDLEITEAISRAHSERVFNRIKSAARSLYL